MGIRVYHIDVARGIAIVLVVLGHCFLSAESPFNRFILSFHMPLFFFLSGIFAKRLVVGQLLGGVISKAKALLVPQITLSFTIIILKGSIWKFDGNSLNDFDYVSCFFYWFLPVLFICSLIFMVLSLFLNYDRIVIRICIITILIGAIVLTDLTNITVTTRIVDWIIKVPVAALFYFCGSFSKANALKTSHFNREGRLSDIKELFVIVAIPFLVIISQLNSPVKMYNNEYGSFLLFLISSFLGIWLILELSKRIKGASFLCKMGQQSIAVYVWNFLVVGFSMRIVNLVIGFLNLNNENILTAVTFFLSIIIITLIVNLSINRFSFIYGIKKI